MSEMVERVARAVAVVDRGQDVWDFMAEDGDGYGYLGKNDYLAMARAAIACDPTEAMVEAAILVIQDQCGIQGRAAAADIVRIVWGRMRNEAGKVNRGEGK